jgi:hypothetical protein
MLLFNSWSFSSNVIAATSASARFSAGNRRFAQLGSLAVAVIVVTLSTDAHSANINAGWNRRFRTASVNCLSPVNVLSKFGRRINGWARSKHPIRAQPGGHICAAARSHDADAETAPRRQLRGFQGASRAA